VHEADELPVVVMAPVVVVVVVVAAGGAIGSALTEEVLRCRSFIRAILTRCCTRRVTGRSVDVKVSASCVQPQHQTMKRIDAFIHAKFGKI
jgi:hypothetical protein